MTRHTRSNGIITGIVAFFIVVIGATLITGNWRWAALGACLGALALEYLEYREEGKTRR